MTHPARTFTKRGRVLNSGGQELSQTGFVGVAGLPGRQSLVWKLLIPTCLAVILIVAAVGSLMPSAVVDAALNDAIMRSKQTADQMRKLRAFYSQNVVAAALRAGTKASPTYLSEPASIPVPTTFVLDAAAAFSTPSVSVKLVSPYPWPTRANRTLDAFETEAWAQLSKTPDGSAVRRETVDGREVLRVAVGDQMDKSCVACHNTNPQSPKKDWHVGDVRGLIEVTTSMDTVTHDARHLSWTLAVTLILAGGVLLIFLLINGVRLILPLRDLTAVIQRLGSGKTQGRVPHLERPDELGMVARALAALEDQTKERSLAEARIAHMAHHDGLTNLANRLMFHQEIQRALTRVYRNQPFALLCLDLDRFKAINDTLGHPIGDQLLVAVARRLQASTREGDVAARLGGDEFALLQFGGYTAQDSVELAERIIGYLSEPYDVDGRSLRIGVSVGIAFAPGDGNTPEDLLKAADMALYRAKSSGGGTCRLFERSMDAKMQARRLVEIDLLAAVPNGELRVYYQPIVNLRADRVSGFEALVRWQHPTRGMVPPGEFIPIAEDIGAIGAIGAWVLRTACADAVHWPGTLNVAVNLSTIQLKTATLVEDVAAALADSGLPAERLELEITESVMLQESVLTLAILNQLRRLGVRISMDDFGTGYSSLSYLRSFPFDKIKIDQSFVREMSHAKESMTVLRAITGLGVSMAMATTAEGVETAEQMSRLRLEGCTEVQGYYFSKPRPAAEVGDMLADARQKLCPPSVADSGLTQAVA